MNTAPNAEAIPVTYFKKDRNKARAKLAGCHVEPVPYATLNSSIPS
jgi:hypothetical protein